MKNIKKILLCLMLVLSTLICNDVSTSIQPNDYIYMKCMAQENNLEQTNVSENNEQSNMTEQKNEESLIETICKWIAFVAFGIGAIVGLVALFTLNIPLLLMDVAVVVVIWVVGATISVIFSPSTTPNSSKPQTRVEESQNKKLEEVESKKKEENKQNDTNNKTEEGVGINGDTVRKYTLGRTMNGFEDKFKDEIYITQSFDVMFTHANEFGIVKKIKIKDEAYVYEFVNQNNMVYMAIYTYKENKTTESTNDAIGWDGSILRHLLYSVDPNLGPLEVRNLALNLNNDKFVIKNDISYHDFKDEATGDRLFIATNKKMFPTRITSIEQIKAKVE